MEVLFFYTRGMRLRPLIALGVFLSLLCVTQISAQKVVRPLAHFLPLERWKAAVLAGNAATLRTLYSSSPPAEITTPSARLTADSELSFWTGLKARGLELQIVQANSPQPGLQQILFQARVRMSPHTLYIAEAQLWQQQGVEWKLISAKRTDATRLEQPLSLDEKIYPAAAGAREEIQSAMTRAAKLHKNVLVVFGADWCYDCHVLDMAFQRHDIAAVVTPNYEVVHVDVGQGDKNQDLMNQFDVPMKRGIPAIAVLDSSGKLLYSQKNGEFERARGLGPEDLLEFLKKWKPQAR